MLLLKSQKTVIKIKIDNFTNSKKATWESHFCLWFNFAKKKNSCYNVQKVTQLYLLLSTFYKGRHKKQRVEPGNKTNSPLVPTQENKL